jgi:purine-binding chemotaxis protein CheW
MSQWREVQKDCQQSRSQFKAKPKAEILPISEIEVAKAGSDALKFQQAKQLLEQADKQILNDHSFSNEDIELLESNRLEIEQAFHIPADSAPVEPVNSDQVESEFELRSLEISLQQSLPERFQVLLCQIGGMTIAVPLLELGGIYPLTNVSKLAGKPNWFLGILIKGEHKYQCIDAFQWLKPEKHTSLANNDNKYQFAIQLAKSPFVVCVDSVSTTLEVQKTDVKWHSEKNRRPWLAGVIKEQMVALVDGAKIADLVQTT